MATLCGTGDGRHRLYPILVLLGVESAHIFYGPVAICYLSSSNHTTGSRLIKSRRCQIAPAVSAVQLSTTWGGSFKVKHTSVPNFMLFFRCYIVFIEVEVVEWIHVGMVWDHTLKSELLTMTSSNGNIFRVTGHLCREFTGPRWIPHRKASDAGLWCFLWCASG